MVGGEVVEVVQMEHGSVWVGTREAIPHGGEVVGVYVDPAGETIRVGDGLWWQGGHCMWTPRVKPDGRSDVRLRKLSGSGVPRPQPWDQEGRKPTEPWWWQADRPWGLRAWVLRLFRGVPQEQADITAEDTAAVTAELKEKLDAAEHAASKNAREVERVLRARGREANRAVRAYRVLDRVRALVELERAHRGSEKGLNDEPKGYQKASNPDVSCRRCDHFVARMGAFPPACLHPDNAGVTVEPGGICEAFQRS